MSISLAKLIREARTRHGSMTQAELSRLVDTSLENITAIENGRNKQPNPDIIAGLSKTLDLRIEEIYAAITGTLNRYPWDRIGDLDLKDPELELMFQQLDSLLDGEPKERVKAFIRFTLDEERRRLARDKESKEKRKSP